MQPYKLCPRCQTPADLNAPACASCGRAYRTQFVPPDQTQIVTPMPAPDPDRVIPPWVRTPQQEHPTVVGVMWLITIAGLFTAFYFSLFAGILIDLGAWGCGVYLMTHGTRKENQHVLVKLIFDLLTFGLAFLLMNGNRPQ